MHTIMTRTAVTSAAASPALLHGASSARDMVAAELRRIARHCWNPKQRLHQIWAPTGSSPF